MYFKYRNTLHTPQKYKKNVEIKNIPYFLPVVYVFCSIGKILHVMGNTLHTPQKYKKNVEIKNIPYFLPVVYVFCSIGKILHVMG